MRKLVLAILILIILPLEWSTCFAATYSSPLGFSVDIPSHWEITNSKILMENPERERGMNILFEAFKIPEQKKKEIMNALKNGQMEYWHYRDTPNNTTCRKIKRKGIIKSSEFKEFIERFKKSHTDVEIYDIGLKKIAGLDVFYFEWERLVRGLRVLQINIQITPQEYFMFSLTAQDDKFQVLKGELWKIISTFKPF